MSAIAPSWLRRFTFATGEPGLPTVIEGLDILPLQYISEDQALDRLSEERFIQLAAKIDEEQNALRLRIRNLKKIVAEEKRHEMNAEGFLALVRKYTDFQELTPEILREFIDKVVVFHRQMEQGVMTQHVEIHFKMIGHVILPALDQKKLAGLQMGFGREEAKALAA